MVGVADVISAAPFLVSLIKIKQIPIIELRQLGLHIIQLQHSLGHLFQRIVLDAVFQVEGKLLHLRINLLLGGSDVVFDGLLQFRDDHPREQSMQAMTRSILISMAPDGDAGLSPQELRMTIVNQKS